MEITWKWPSTLTLSGVFTGCGWGLTLGEREVAIQMWGISIPIGGGVYFGIACTAVVGIIVLHWTWLQALRPSVRFRAKADLLDAVRDGLHKDHPERQNSHYNGPPTYTSPNTKTLLHHTIRELGKLNVPHPPFAYKVNRWIIFLERVAADARSGDLRTARTRWPLMKRDDGDSDEG